MKLSEFGSFVKSKLMVTLLLLLVAEINAIFSSLPKELSVSMPIIAFLIGSFILFRQYRQEKSTKFINKLHVFVEEFRDHITNPSYVYSFPSIALEVAGRKEILTTRGWEELLSKLSENLTIKVCVLLEKIEKSSGKEFTSLFEDFRQTLILLKENRKEFYKMVDEIGLNFAMNFSLDTQFKDGFNRFFKEYNGCMDRLAIFSDDLKAELGLTLDKNLIEHFRSLSDLGHTIYP